MLKIVDVTKKFNQGTIDENIVFDRFNFQVEKGEFVSVIGSNGSGKSTLLNLICGTADFDDGDIFFDGKSIRKMSEYKRAKFIGRVYQEPRLGTCGSLTIAENMALADNKHKSYGLTKCLNKSRLDYYKTLLEKCDMGLENRMDARVEVLSGGQRQALALVIANMCDIKLLILDEHTAALDPKSSDTVMKLTDKLVKEKGITTLMVTHNLRFATQYGTRLVMMHEGNCVMDVSGEEKENMVVDDLLDKFYEISIEKGNRV